MSQGGFLEQWLIAIIISTFSWRFQWRLSSFSSSRATSFFHFPSSRFFGNYCEVYSRWMCDLASWWKVNPWEREREINHTKNHRRKTSAVLSSVGKALFHGYDVFTHSCIFVRAIHISWLLLALPWVRIQLEDFHNMPDMFDLPTFDSKLISLLTLASVMFYLNHIGLERHSVDHLFHRCTGELDEFLMNCAPVSPHDVSFSKWSDSRVKIGLMYRVMDVLCVIHCGLVVVIAHLLRKTRRYEEDPCIKIFFFLCLVNEMIDLCRSCRWWFYSHKPDGINRDTYWSCQARTMTFLESSCKSSVYRIGLSSRTTANSKGQPLEQWRDNSNHQFSLILCWYN